jgi:hypothetical protein
VKIIALQGRERKLLLTNRGQSLEIIELTCQLSALEDMKVDYLQSILDAKQSNEEHSERRTELERKIRADDRVTRTKELADLRQLWIRDQNLGRDHELFQQQKAVEFALSDNENKKNGLKLTEILLNSTDFKRPSRGSATQTGKHNCSALRHTHQ